ncbi:hypothetical protein [Roseateles sp. L2-2]|uniref:hypothetical protein n=1 Tax=Roseateles sp. L2-2 TaxID=3422597 RepID=UPI003D35C825
MKNCSFQIGSGVLLNDRHYVVEACGQRTITLQDIETKECTVESRADVLHAFQSGALLFDDLLADADAQPVVLKGLSDYNERDRRDVALKRALLNRLCPNGIVQVRRADLPAAIRDVWSTLPGAEGRPPPSPATFYDWRRRWLRAEQRDTALVNRFDLRGRRPQPVPKELAPILDQAVDKIYLRAERGTISETWKAAQGLVDEHNEARSVEFKLPRPTRRQIERAIEKIGRYQRLSRRYGRKVAEVKTSVYGKGPGAERLLDRVEADHARLNVICIDAETGAILGRPWITVLIDVASRMIVAAVIGFETPNAQTVLSALKQAILPKDALLRRYKVKGSWPACGVMVSLVCDNGTEFHSDAVEKACTDIGVTLVFCPRNEPRYKGVIERFMKTINHDCVHTLPGTTFSNPKERGDYDSEGSAVLTIDQLRALMYRWIVEVYAQEFHRGIQASPLQRWDELAKLRPPVLPRHPEVLDVMARPQEFRWLSSKGIEINSQFYSSDVLKELFHTKGRQRLTVRPDGENLAEIDVLHPTTNSYFKAFSTDPEYACGLTVEQNKLLRREGRARYAGLDHRSASRAARHEMTETVKALKLQGEQLKAIAEKHRAGGTGKVLGIKAQTPLQRAARQHADKADACFDQSSERLPKAVPTPDFVPFDRIEGFPSTGQRNLFS